MGRTPSREQPLFVYLPCGVGGSPGGITYGLKAVFGDAVHAFFAEPVAAPCMLVQLSASGEGPLSVYDIGLDNKTDADGLAVAQASHLVAPLMRARLGGVFTVRDDDLLRDTRRLFRTEGIRLEPSAIAAARGPLQLTGTEAGRAYLAQRGLPADLAEATHVIWSTGGSLVPPEEHERYQAKGAQLLVESA
jgi:D-serine dehydratase